MGWEHSESKGRLHTTHVWLICDSPSQILPVFSIFPKKMITWPGQLGSQVDLKYRRILVFRSKDMKWNFPGFYVQADTCWTYRSVGHNALLGIRYSHTPALGIQNAWWMGKEGEQVGSFGMREKLEVHTQMGLIVGLLCIHPMWTGSNQFAVYLWQNVHLGDLLAKHIFS